MSDGHVPGRDPFETDEEFYRRASAVLADLAVQAGAKIDALDEVAEQLESVESTLNRVDTTLARVERSMTFYAKKDDMKRRNRLGFIRQTFLVIWIGVVLMAITTAKVEACSPGARAEDVLVELLSDDVSLDGLRAVARRPAPSWCDVAFPTNTHSLQRDWPTHNNTMGIVVYGLFGLLTIYVVRPRKWEYADGDDLPG